MIAPAPAIQASAANDKPGTRDLWSKLAWPLLLACGLLIFVSASSIYLVISLQSSREVMNRSLQLEKRLWEIMAVVRIAESEQRDYLLQELRDSLGNALPVIIFATNGAGVPCAGPVQLALSKSRASLVRLTEMVRDHLVLPPTRPLTEVA